MDGEKIKAADSGAVQSGYIVDSFFNVTAPDGSVSHLFYENAPFQVQRTSYLYLRKSTDGGTTWSDPMLLPLKNNMEKAYLVGPGRGIVTKTGMIVFPCYSYNGSNESQRMNFIYSTDNGQTWKRSTDSAPDGEVMWSSESAVVELPDGTLRFFSEMTGSGSAIGIIVQMHGSRRLSRTTKPIPTRNFLQSPIQNARTVSRLFLFRVRRDRDGMDQTARMV